MSEAIIKVADLSVSYDGKMILEGIDFTLYKGEIYGLLGRNGAGKTTFIKSLLGLIDIDTGEIAILSEKLVDEWSKAVLSQIGVVLDSASFYPNLTAKENLSIFATLRGISLEQVEEALVLVGLESEQKKLFKQYSLGMKQRLAIANAIMHNPQILILDEPTNGLDPIGILEMRQFLRELSASQGISILISSHIISEVEKLVDRIGILHGGRLLAEKNVQDMTADLENSTVHVVLSDAIQAKEVLDQLAMFEKVSVLSDTELVLEGDSFDIAEIASVLKKNAIVIKEYSHHKHESLEDYFKRVTGGEGIA